MGQTLRQTGSTDIQTAFRFELYVEADTSNSSLGVTSAITGYIQSSGLPSASGDPIPWTLPGGMVNYQAGVARTKPIPMEFVVSTSENPSAIRTFEKWRAACYDLNTGTNKGKSAYCTDGIQIRVKTEKQTIKYAFKLLRAQVSDVTYNEVSSESSELLRVSCSLTYDNYAVYDGNGVLITNQTNG